MTESEYLAAIAEEVSRSGKATPRSLELIEQALRDHPASPALWSRKGDLIQISDDDGIYSLGDALASYRQALALDPQNREARSEVANFLDLHGELNGRTG
jgi:tetratricopeptide (TPR) repeat protein